jgi:hypothetical protein
MSHEVLLAGVTGVVGYFTASRFEGLTIKRCQKAEAPDRTGGGTGSDASEGLEGYPSE